MPVTWYEACWAKGAGGVFGIQSTVALRRANTKSAGIRCHIPATVEAVNTWPGSHTLCAFQDSPRITFLFEDRGGQCVLPAGVFMPQLAADVPVQRKFGPKESTCQDCSGGRNLPNPDNRRFSSSGLQKPPVHLPLWHDLDTMSDSSLWTVLSNFNMPHFFSGARLRRSKRYRLKQFEVVLYFLLYDVSLPILKSDTAVSLCRVTEGHFSDYTGDLTCSFCPREWQHRCFSWCLHSVIWAELWGQRE